MMVRSYHKKSPLDTNVYRVHYYMHIFHPSIWKELRLWNTGGLEIWNGVVIVYLAMHPSMWVEAPLKDQSTGVMTSD